MFLFTRIISVVLVQGFQNIAPTLLMLWTVLTLIIPGFSAYLGATLRPAPPSYAIAKQVQDIKLEENRKARQKLETYGNRLNATASPEKENLEELQEQFEAYRNLVFRKRSKVAIETSPASDIPIHRR